MKRKEFIEKVEAESLIRCKGLRTDTKAGRLELIGILLDIKEELGMAPPENVNQEVVDNCLSGRYWEPEDECYTCTKKCDECVRDND